MSSPARGTPAYAAWRRAKDLIAFLGGDAIDNSDGDVVDVNVYSPTGYIWRATDCHSLTCHYFTDAAAGWTALVEDLEKGLAPCDAKDCEVCNEEQPTAEAQDE